MAEMIKEYSPTRDGFRAALERVRTYEASSPAITPAVYSTAGERLRSEPLPMRERPRSFAARETSISQALGKMGRGELTAATLAQESLAAIDKRNGILNAFVYVAPADAILEETGRLDAERRSGRTRGPLHGIPLSVKDVIHVAGMPTTASSRVLSTVPDEDATAVARLRKAGALILGKTQTHEFALGVTTPQSRNPYDESRDPGGSSGGSAIAVATGMGLGSLGTDTRASIRVPAALSSTVGYKATYGLVPTDGVVTLSWSLDHVAPMARTVEDAALLLDVLASAPPRDAARYADALQRDVQGLAVAIPRHAVSRAEPAVLARFERAADALRTAGVQVSLIDEPGAEDFAMANAMGLIVSRCEAAAYQRALHADPLLYTTPVMEQLDEASRVSGVDYVQAQRWRAEFMGRMRSLLTRFDALLMPTSPVVAPKREVADQFLLVLSENCVPWSFIGFPAVSVPSGLTAEGLPTGAELVAGPWEDVRLLALAAALEETMPEN